SLRVRALNSVDLPTLGSPTMPRVSDTGLQRSPDADEGSPVGGYPVSRGGGEPGTTLAATAGARIAERPRCSPGQACGSGCGGAPLVAPVRPFADPAITRPEPDRWSGW